MGAADGDGRRAARDCDGAGGDNAGVLAKLREGRGRVVACMRLSAKGVLGHLAYVLKRPETDTFAI